MNAVTNVPNYKVGDDFVLMELDESKVNMDNIIPSMVRDSIVRRPPRR